MIILIVDDIEQNLCLLQVVLESNGYQVVAATNGVEALAKARQNPPNLIVSDILMPAMDGFVLCREWKKDERLRSVPFIFCTATYTDERDREFGLSLGAERFIVKPVETKVLLQMIREVIQLAQRTPAAPIRVPIEAPQEESAGYLKQYSEVLIRKLEAKMEQLDQVNRELERDITERKRIEDELRKGESKFRRLYDSNVIGIIFWNTAGNIIQANSEFLRIVGYTEEDVISGKVRWKDMTPLEYAYLDEKAIKEMTETGISVPYEKEYIRKDGSRVLIRLNAAFLKGEKDIGVCYIQDISERKKAEDELQKLNAELEQRVRQRTAELADASEELGIIIDSSPIMIFYKDIKNRFIRVNKAFAESQGVQKEDLEGKSIFDLYPQDADNYWKNDKEVAASGQPKRNIIEPLETMAGRRWVQTDKVPFRNAKGIIIGIIGFTVDITELKQAEERLRKSEERFRSLVTATSQIIWTTNAQGEVEEDIPSYRDFTGQSLEEVKGWGWISAVHPEDRERSAAVWSEAVRTRSLYETEYRLLRYDGEYRYLSARGVPLLEEDGSIREWVGYCVDITERKQAEEALRASEARYRAYMEVTGQIGWTTPPDGVVEDMPEWRKYTGQSLEEVKGWGWLNAMHPDDRVRTTEVWNKAVAAKSIYETEYRIRRHDGVYRYFLARGIPSLREDGMIREWVGTCIDITDRKIAEEELKKYSSQLEVVNKELEAFSYSVSHDLRAPLRGMYGFTKALLEEYADKFDDIGKGYLARVRSAAKNMGKLIDDLLELSRISRIEKKIGQVNLSACAERIAGEFKKDAPERKVEFLIQPNLSAWADAHLIEIALQNMLDNAWKFTSKNPLAKIEFGLMKSKDREAYFVRDDGVGFDSRYYDKLFNPFQRLHSEKEFPGTGIGLATVKRIIERHGGRVWAESEVGKGTTFYFTLNEKKEAL